MPVHHNICSYEVNDGFGPPKYLQEFLRALGVVVDYASVSRDVKQGLPPIRAQTVNTVNNIFVEAETPI